MSNATNHDENRKTDNCDAPPVVAYAALVSPADDECSHNNRSAQQRQQTDAIVAHLNVHSPNCGGSVSPAWAAQLPPDLVDNLKWRDTFFAPDDDDSNGIVRVVKEEDIVAVFDLDHASMEQYYSSLAWLGYFSTLVCCPGSGLFGWGLLLGVPCFLRPNVRWNVRSQHLVVTRDGITFCHARRPTCYGMPCTDAGQYSKTIPFDQITDVEIVEPAGNTCGCIANTLHTVHIDTTGGAGGRRHELSISGLFNPHAFRELVLTMTRLSGNSSSPPVPAAMARTVQQATAVLDTTAVAASISSDGTTSNEDVATLLRDIRDELRNHNQALQQQSSSAQVVPSAPVESMEML